MWSSTIQLMMMQEALLTLMKNWHEILDRGVCLTQSSLGILILSHINLSSPVISVPKDENPSTTLCYAHDR